MSSRISSLHSWHFLAAARTTPLGFGPQEPAAYGDPLQEALDDHRIASLMAPSGRSMGVDVDRSHSHTYIHTVLLTHDVRFHDPGELEALHRDRWKDQWGGAGIELEMQPNPLQKQPSAASVPLPAAVNASLLALLSAGREDWSYGVAAWGLTEGDHGHVRWGTTRLHSLVCTDTTYIRSSFNDMSLQHNPTDSEIFILPALLLINPVRAQAMLQYRLERLSAAEAKARGATPPADGAMYPWESAYTGIETAGEGANDYVEHAVVRVGEWAPRSHPNLTSPKTHTTQHVTGAIAWAAWQCFLATQDRLWLAAVGFPLLEAVARFYTSRVQLDADGSAHIRRVVPPDGKAGVVDDSVYTNGLAVLCLRHAASAARLLGGAVAASSVVDVATIERWEALAAAIVLPVDPSLAEEGGEGVHPEFAGYAGQGVKQADTVLLGHPLGLYGGALSGREDGETQRRAGAADVGYYGARYDSMEGVGALTWGMQAVNLLDLGMIDGRKCYIHVVGI